MSDSEASKHHLPVLTIVGGAGDGTQLVLEEPDQLLGADPDCHLVVEGANVSPVHARLLCDDRGVILTDANSVAGTFVNGQRLEQEQLLRDGDSVGLGPPDAPDAVSLTVRLPPAAHPEEGPALAPPEEAAPVPAQEPPALKLADLEPPALRAADLEPPALKLAEPEVDSSEKGQDRPPAEEPPALKPAEPEAAAPPATEAPADTPRAAASRPEFTTGPPSIIPEHPRPEGGFPPAPRQEYLPTPLPWWLRYRTPLIAAGAALVAVGGFAALQSLQRPAAVVLAVMPPNAQPGQDVSITGERLESDPAASSVHFGEMLAPVTSASATRVIAKVPEGLLEHGSMKIPVSVEARGVRSNALFLRVYVPARFDSLTPRAAMPGEEVVVEGERLGGETVAVMVGGVPAEVTDVQPTAIRFRVPNLPLTNRPVRKVNVKVGEDWAHAADLFLGRLPIVTEVEPPRGATGQHVTVRGYGFDPTLEGNTVSFGKRRALVLSATDTELGVMVPAGDIISSQRETRVVVRTGRATSARGTTFTILRPSTTHYVPRFFAEPIPRQSPSQHVFVSTELGPVLLLSGRGELASTAHRGALVADRLNLLTGAAVSEAVNLHVVGGSAPAVVARERNMTVVTPSRDDVAGYAKRGLGLGRGSRASPQRLASYWAALLQDYLSLFVQRQRPYRVLEMSPRGQVLADLYREAAIRGGAGAGVPVRLVVSLDAAVSDGLRRLALAVPAEGEGAGSAVVEGHWEGTMQETGEGARSVRVRLFRRNSRLAGALTARSGAVSGELPLRSLSFDGQALRFILDAGGYPRHFRGTFDGSTIEGTIHAEEGATTAIGSFSLRYTQ